MTNSEFESQEHISIRNSGVLAVGKRHGPAPLGDTGDGASVRLSRILKKENKEENNLPAGMALPKMTRRVQSLRKLKAAVGVNLSQQLYILCD